MRHTVIEQQACKQQAEQHHQAPNEIRHSLIPTDNADKQTDRRRREIEQHQHKDELEELRPGRYEPSHRVDDTAQNYRRNEPQRHDVEEDFGGEVGDGVIISVGTFTEEKKTLRSEDGERSEGGEPEQSEDEEEQPQPILEPLDVVGEAVEEKAREDSEKDGDGVMSEHQHRIAVQIPPGAKGEDGELGEEARTGIRLHVAARADGRSRGVAVRSAVRSGVIGFPCTGDGGLNRGRDRLSHLRRCVAID